jgi:hypothetical protein
MKKSVCALLAGASILVGCDKPAPAPAPAPGAKPAEEKVGENPLNAPTDYLKTVAKAKKSAEGSIDTISINSAISSFQAEKGRNPTNLDELVTSGTIKQIPAPPYNMKYNFDKEKGTVTVVPK